MFLFIVEVGSSCFCQFRKKTECRCLLQVPEFYPVSVAGRCVHSFFLFLFRITIVLVLVPYVFFSKKV